MKFIDVNDLNSTRVGIRQESKAQFIRRAAAVRYQIGRIKFGSSTVAARRMNRSF